MKYASIEELKAAAKLLKRCGYRPIWTDGIDEFYVIDEFGRVDCGMREVKPLPPGATRHPAISENCLRLSDGAEWMKYGGSR